MLGDLLDPVHLILLLVVALLVFGPKRLPEVGKGLGETLREFRKAMHAQTENADQAPNTPTGTGKVEAVKAIGDRPGDAAESVSNPLEPRG